MPRTSRLLPASVILLALTLTGCGASNQTAAHTPAVKKVNASATPAASGAPIGHTATPSPAKALPVSDILNPAEAARIAALPPFTGPVTDKFSTNGIMSAYKSMVMFAENYGYTSALMNSHPYTVDDFMFINKFLTPDAQVAWKEGVEKELAGKSAGKTFIESFTFFDSSKKWKVTFDPTITVNPTATLPTVEAFSTTGGLHLKMTFKVTSSVQLVQNGKPYTGPFSRDLTVWLLPNRDPAHPWLIDYWKGTINKNSVHLTPRT